MIGWNLMNKFFLKFKIFFLSFFISINVIASTNLEKIIDDKSNTQQTEFPSLELLLYLGEFQDKDGTLLEPEKFDDNLKLDKTEQVITDENTQNETNIPQVTKVTKVTKEDDDE